MDSFLRERIFYEIAMSIGNSTDMHLMLKECLPTYLRKLNCLAGAVLHLQEEDGRFSFKAIHAIPKRLKPSSALLTALEGIPAHCDRETLENYLRSLPFEETHGNHRVYVMELPDFGLLMLMKSEPGLTMPVRKSLAPLNAKLAGSCRSCLASERLHKEILERERAEQDYRSIFENSVEGIFRTTVEGRVLEANPSIARLLGFDSPDDFMTQVYNVAEQLYVNPVDRERLIKRLMRKGRVSNFEAQFHRKDGTIGWGALSARLIKDGNGEPLHIEGMFTDISHRMKAMKVLRTAKDEAVRLNNMKSSFLSMVSHELRTPLTSILGFAKLARKQIDDLRLNEAEYDPKLSKTLRRIADNSGVIIAEGERLTELINNVLDLAKLESGSCQWDMKGVDLNEILDHCITTSDILFDGTEVALTKEIERPLPNIKGDRDRLVQVMLNLLSNARKFTPRGTVHVTAQTNGDEVIVKVIDTGIGVPEEDKEDIFDKFRQSGNTLTDKPQGTGLGLPICKEIIENHGGALWLEPNKPKGSIFVFTLPIVLD